MGKKIISLLLAAALMVTTMGMAAAAVPDTVQGKLAMLEVDTYGAEQTGAVMDRLNKMEKDYDGKRRLYGNDGCWDVKTKSVKLVDYIGYLRCPRKYKTYYDIHPVRSEYNVLRDSISTQKRYVSMWERELRKIHKKIGDLMEERNRYEEYRNEAYDSLDKARERAEELRDKWKM